MVSDGILPLVRIIAWVFFSAFFPSDVDVQSPDEKSIITYVAQFLQYSNDMPAPDDHLQVELLEKASLFRFCVRLLFILSQSSLLNAFIRSFFFWLFHCISPAGVRAAFPSGSALLCLAC